jgi:hypothetical protein
VKFEVQNKANCPKRGAEAVFAVRPSRWTWNPPPFAGPAVLLRVLIKSVDAGPARVYNTDR